MPVDSGNDSDMKTTAKRGLQRQRMGGGRPQRPESGGDIPFSKLLELGRAALPKSRPMADWEKRAADEFFWSQFTADASSQPHGPPA